MQQVLGQQQIEICRCAASHGQLARHVAQRTELADGEPVDLDFHHRVLGGVEVCRIGGRKFNGGQQPVIEGDRQQPFVLLLHLSQQT